MGSEIVTTMIGKVLENSLLFGILVFIGIVLWKRYVQHIEKTEKKLEEYEKRMNEYMEVDRQKMQQMIKDNTEAFNSFKETNEKTNYLLNVFIQDMQEFKKSDTYQQYRRDKKT